MGREPGDGFVRILYHHRTRAEDAQGIHIDALCRAFEGLGHQVRLVGPARPRGFSKHSGQRTANSLFGFSISPWIYELLALAYNVPAFALLCWHIVRFRPHLLYERYALFNIAGRLATAVFRIPFVLEVNAPLSDELQDHGSLRLTKLARRVEDWLCKSATRTVVVSGVMRDLFLQRGIPREQLLVVPNGVDVTRFHPKVDGQSVRARLGLDQLFVVGFVGWMRPWHGLDGLLRAAADLCDEITELRLLLVGDGPVRPALHETALELGIGERVIFTGPVASEEVPAYIAAMDVAVQPEVTEYASPIKLFEYLAMARAVIAPRKPNIVEIIRHSEQALLFTPGSHQELADCIRELYNSPSLRKTLAERAARLIDEQNFRWETNARRVLKAVKS